MAKREKRTPRTKRISNKDFTSPDFEATRGSYDGNRFEGNSVVSVVTFDNRIDFSLYDRRLNRIRNKILTRMFIEGKNSSDASTNKSKFYKRDLYRYYTGKLYRSFRIVADKGLIKIKLTRNKVIIQYIERLYGTYFKISDSDLNYINQEINSLSNKLNYENIIIGKVII